MLNPEPLNNWNLHFGVLFSNIWSNYGEIWKTYNTAKLEYPSEEEIKNSKAIIIGGSSDSAYC